MLCTDSLYGMVVGLTFCITERIAAQNIYVI